MARSDASHCLSTPRPVEYYGSAELWPASFDVSFSDALFCEVDGDCPGSYCDLKYIPHVCAPKVLKHYLSPAEDFLSPAYES